ncbi:MAG: hypothetical protein HY791_01050 [Deltaproteobacteria bacterium]|nr:hypothetical protein [Deltaproteobacteria bacterium]
MFRSPPPPGAGPSCLLLVLALPSAALADGPKILIFGGGPSPSLHQASIEVQTQRLISALQSRSPLVVFGAPPEAPSPVQVEGEFDADAELLGMLFDRPDALHAAYRSQQIQSARPLTKDALVDAIKLTVGSSSGAAIFGVGHGGRGEEQSGSTLELWGADSLSVQELSTLLDDTRPPGPVAFVLGQCFSGGFTAIAMRKDRLVTPTRCVLAAVPSDREAAGCTSDVSSPDSRAYTHFVARALSAPDGDIDGDGKVSLLEAHSRARILDPTIDVPVSSLEAYVAGAIDRRGKRPPIGRFTIDAILAIARPEEREVLKMLTPSTTKTVGEVVATRDSLNAEADKTDEELTDREDELDVIVRRIRIGFFGRWPELANPFHKRSRQLLAGDAREVLDWVRSTHQADLEALADVTSEVRRLSDRLFAQERILAKLERFVRSAEIVVFEQELRRRGTRAQRSELDALLACERMVP